MRVWIIVAAFVIACSNLAIAQDSAQPFAVVELFGSEGCSSCPPADDLLKELTREARNDGSRIYTLSFHVDYWNYLGWPDPFSKAEYTERQRQYAAVLPSSSVYTPQMIVNGSDGFVGSDSSKARSFIKQALKSPAGNSISVKIIDGDSNNVRVQYRCAQSADNAVIHFALVERGVVSQVTRGENAGRTLEHDNVVRAFKSLPLAQKEGSVDLIKPSANDLSRFSVVAFVQNATDMKIIAASSIDLTHE